LEERSANGRGGKKVRQGRTISRTETMVPILAEDGWSKKAREWGKGRGRAKKNEDMSLVLASGLRGQLEGRPTWGESVSKGEGEGTYPESKDR
jgi:hypothetical protein